MKVVIESLRLNELTWKAWECILEIRIEENSSEVREIDVFLCVLKWTEQNEDEMEKEQILKLFLKIRLELIDMTDLIEIVRQSEIYNADFVLDAIKKKYSPESQRCGYCRNPVFRN